MKEHKCHGCGQVAGDTTASFAAVFCCPCALLHLAALAFVKLPAGLCKKTLKKIRRKLKAKKRVQDKPANDNEETVCEESSVVLSRDEFSGSSDARGLVKVQVTVTRLSTEECWEQITGKSHVGFWRNYSLD
jgi:hypothetical protein